MHYTLNMTRCLPLLLLCIYYGLALQTQMFLQVHVIQYELLMEAKLQKTKLQCFHHCLIIQGCQGVKYDFGQCWFYTNLLFVYSDTLLEGLEKLWLTEETGQLYQQKESGVEGVLTSSTLAYKAQLDPNLIRGKAVIDKVKQM